MFLEKNFIASAVGLRTVTATFNVADAEEIDGKKVIKAGAYFAGNGGSGSSGSASSGTGSSLAGITLDDVYFKEGQTTVIGAVIVAGHIYKDRLPVELADDVIYELASQGLFFETAPTTVIAE